MPASPRPAAARCARADCAPLPPALGRCLRPTSFMRGCAESGIIGRRARAGSTLEWRAMNCLTARSSSEWKLMTARRPPGASTSNAAARPACSWPSSSLMNMRSAWKVRVAGFLPGSRVRTARATSSASCAVRVMGARSRAVAMACATRRAKRSSPSVAITSRISSTPARASHAATGSPRVGSMRISSGPSARKLKPRSGVSSCGDDTPRSKSTPAHCCPCACAGTSSARSENGACWSVRRRSLAKRSRPAAMAWGSRSSASTRPSPPKVSRMRAVWPPRPNVAST